MSFTAYHRRVEITVRAADGTRLVARRTGRGAPVVLVHGSAGGLDSWDPITPLLDDEFEVWVYARRGYPPSDDCEQPKTYADDVADLRAVLAAAGGSAHVAGASYGGTVALRAAVAGAALRTLVVFEPPLFAAGPAVASALAGFRELLAAGDVAGANRVFAAQVARVPAPILAALPDAGGDPGEAVGSLHDLEAMAADTPDLSRWASIAIPALIMQGSDTWAPMPSTMDSLAAAMPAAARAILPGQSHFATHTAPGLFARTIRDFLHERG